MPQITLHSRCCGREVGIRMLTLPLHCTAGNDSNAVNKPCSVPIKVPDTTATIVDSSEPPTTTSPSLVTRRALGNSDGSIATGLQVPTGGEQREGGPLRRKPSICPIAPDGSVMETDIVLLHGTTAMGQIGDSSGVTIASEEESVSDFDSSPTGVDDKEAEDYSG